ncbi:hypothetical protein ABPG75_010564 [Micractinium tetrahymenae]
MLPARQLPQWHRPLPRVRLPPNTCDTAYAIYDSEEKGCGCLNIFCCQPYSACPSPSPSPSPDISTTTSSSTTSSSPDSGSSCPYNISPGYDLKGGDLSDGVVSVSDDAECCSICNDNSDCYAWVYAPYNDACNGPCCFLKDNSWTEYVADGDLVAGTYAF